MPNTTSGPAVGTQKETVYGGPAPTGNAGGTGYNGPTAGGTGYQGPGLNNAAADNSRMAQMIRATQQAGRDKGGKIFFIIAGFSALNTLLIAVKAPFTMAIGLSVTRISLDEHLGVVLLINAIAIGLF